MCSILSSLSVDGTKKKKKNCPDSRDFFDMSRIILNASHPVSIGLWYLGGSC